jgi:hypothetical protein
VQPFLTSTIAVLTKNALKQPNAPFTKRPLALTTIHLCELLFRGSLEFARSLDILLEEKVFNWRQFGMLPLRQRQILEAAAQL